MPDTITTPDALMALSNELSDFSDKLDDYIEHAPDPFNSEMMQLRILDARIAVDAKVIAGIAADLAAPGVLQAIGDLNVQLGCATETLSGDQQREASAQPDLERALRRGGDLDRQPARRGYRRARACGHPQARHQPQGRHQRGAILKRRRHAITQERQPC
jgi:hypothetical protein